MSDKGFGSFGSHEWHVNYINALDDSLAVSLYVRDLTGFSLEVKPTLEETKEQAIKMIKVH